MMRVWTSSISVCGFTAIAWSSFAQAAPARICVSVQIKSYRDVQTKARKSSAHTRRVVKASPRRLVARPAAPVASPGVPAPGAPAARPGGAAEGHAAPRAVERPRRTYVRKRHRHEFEMPPDLSRHRRRRRIRYRRSRRHRRSVYPYPPAAYLKRLVEHYVTHRKGYVAVQSGCAERIRIELYPLRVGWTAFASYSGSAQEEKVDVIYYEEFPRFAERAVVSLLTGHDIASVASLRTVLRADSLRTYRTVKGTHFFAFSLGTTVLVATIPRFVESSDSGDVIDNKLKALTPLVFSLGYRGRFNAWGIDLAVRGGAGLSRISANRNPDGGNVDLGGFFQVGLTFLRYRDPHGMISFYYGAGAEIDVTVFESIRPSDQRGSTDRDRIAGGGFTLLGVLGYEFMRASAAQFFIQLTLGVPAWMFDSQEKFSQHISTYIPELSAVVGMLF